MHVNYSENITKDGYLFLLNEIPKQVWQLVQCYLTTQVSESGRTSAVSFLIFLGTLSPGNPYETTTLTKSEVSLLKDWALFGLVELLDDVRIHRLPNEYRMGHFRI
jgi:hypothetical protein